VLSGGLPRELLRVARSIVRAVQYQQDQHPKTQPGSDVAVDIAQVVDAVIKEEVRALKHRALASATANDACGKLGLLEGLLTDEDWPWKPDPQDAQSVLQAIVDSVRSLVDPEQLLLERAVPDEVKAGVFAAEVCNSLIAGAYFLFTVRRVFLHWETAGQENTATAKEVGTPRESVNDALVGKLSDALLAAEKARAEGSGSAESGPDALGALARARVALGVSPDLAADLVTAARDALKAGKEGGHDDFSVPVPIKFLHRYPQPATTPSPLTAPYPANEKPGPPMREAGTSGPGSAVAFDGAT